MTPPSKVFHECVLSMVGVPLIKFLPCLAKIQISLPRGKKKVKVRTIKSRTTIGTSPLSRLLIAKSPISSYLNCAVAMHKFSVYQLPSVQLTNTAARGNTFCVRLYSLIFHHDWFYARNVVNGYAQSFLRHLIVINPSTVDCKIFLLFRIFLAPKLDQSFDS